MGLPGEVRLNDNDQRVLFLLVDARHSGKRYTQRSLAGELGLPLSTVHSALLRLADKDLVAMQPRGALRALVAAVPTTV